METQEKKLDWKLGVIIVLAILLLLSFEKCTSNAFKLGEKEELIEAMEDSLKTWVDKDGNNRARITTLETSSAKDFINLQTKDKEIQRLQAIAEKNEKYLKSGGSVIGISTQGSYTYKGNKPKVEWNKDRIADLMYNPCDTVYPTYSDSFVSKGKWIWGNMKMGLNEVELNVQYRDSLDIVLGREKTGFLGLGKGKPFGDITSYNPYTAVKQFKTYNVTDKTPPRRFGIGPVVAYGFGTGTLQPQFFFGIGGSYNLIRF